MSHLGVSSPTSASASASASIPAPAPISWEPSEYWDGIDGNWSSFPLRVGAPSQLVRVLISTAWQATSVVFPDGCSSDIPKCAQSRGSTFNPALSHTWRKNANYSLGLETYLGYDVPGMFGFDSLALGLSDAAGGPSLEKQVIAGVFDDYDFYIGTFGLGNQPFNFTNFDHPHPSFLTSLKSNGLIPSLSWSYTAGAYYQNSFGSLTFGGYDLSKFIPNNITFFLAGDVARDLVVKLQSITATNSTDSLVSLLDSPISTFIDSTLPYIYLPTAACSHFKETFGLVWDSSYELYTVNEEAHKNLLSSNWEFTFKIGNSTNDEPTVDIVLPYASFDLTATSPLVDNITRYFPIQRGNESQYVLGRAFLQEAYLIVNYEQSNFSVSQRKFQGDLHHDIIAMTTAELGTPPPATPLPTIPSDRPGTRGYLSLGAMLGLAIGPALLLILSFLIIVILSRRRRSKRLEKSNQLSNRDSPQSNSPNPWEISSIKEIDTKSVSEVPDSGKAELQDHQTHNHPHYFIQELQINRLSVEPENKTQTAAQTGQPIIYELMAQALEIDPNTPRTTPKSTTFSKSSIQSNPTTISNPKSHHQPRIKHRKPLFPNPPSLDEKKIRFSGRRISRGLNRPLPPTPDSSPRVSKLRFSSDHERLMRRMGIVPRVGSSGEF